MIILPIVMHRTVPAPLCPNCHRPENKTTVCAACGHKYVDRGDPAFDRFMAIWLLGAVTSFSAGAYYGWLKLGFRGEPGGPIDCFAGAMVGFGIYFGASILIGVLTFSVTTLFRRA